MIFYREHMYINLKFAQPAAAQKAFFFQIAIKPISLALLIVFQLLSSQPKHARKAHLQLVIAFYKGFNSLCTSVSTNFTFHKKASFPAFKLIW